MRNKQTARKRKTIPVSSRRRVCRPHSRGHRVALQEEIAARIPLARPPNIHEDGLEEIPKCSSSEEDYDDTEHGDKKPAAAALALENPSSSEEDSDSEDDEDEDQVDGNHSFAGSVPVAAGYPQGDSSGEGFDALTPGAGSLAGIPTPRSNSEDEITAPERVKKRTTKRKPASARIISDEARALLKFDDVPGNKAPKEEKHPAKKEFKEFLLYRKQYAHVGKITGDHDLEAIAAPPPGTPISCCVFAGARVTSSPFVNMRCMLREALFRKLSPSAELAIKGDVNPNGVLGCPKKDHYHVSLLVDALTTEPYNRKLTTIPSNLHNDALWRRKKQKLLVIGTLNMDFTPWHWHNIVIESGKKSKKSTLLRRDLKWDCKKCQKNRRHA